MNQKRLIVEAELIELGPEPDLPGDTLSISVSRYALLRVVIGEYLGRVLLVGHRYEDRMSPNFAIGCRHRLELTRRFPTNATLLNSFSRGGAEMPVFFCETMHTL
jgi:hypothetical protein